MVFNLGGLQMDQFFRSKVNASLHTDVKQHWETMEKNKRQEVLEYFNLLKQPKNNHA